MPPSRLPSLAVLRTEIARLARFLGVGAINALGTYLLYLALHRVLPYGAAFSLSFAAGILFSLWANGRYVFAVRLSVRLAAAYAAFYLLSYLASLGLLVAAVEAVGLPSWLAPLPVAAVMTVINFIGARLLMLSGIARAPSVPAPEER